MIIIGSHTGIRLILSGANLAHRFTLTQECKIGSRSQRRGRCRCREREGMLVFNGTFTTTRLYCGMQGGANEFKVKVASRDDNGYKYYS